jgi:hypothetical protein
MVEALCEVQGCEREAESGPLCVVHAEGGRYVACRTCGAVAEYDGLRALGTSLGGWAVISEGAEEYCPAHRPDDLLSGYHVTREEALAR